MTLTRNPFRYGSDGDSDDLVDRKAETAQVEATIRNGEKLFLIGPRRFGKTSILQSVDETLTYSGGMILHLNAEAFPSMDMLVGKILSLAATRLQTEGEIAIEQMGKFFSELKPEFKYNSVARKLSVRMSVDPAVVKTRPIKLFVDALDGLEMLARTQPRSRPVGLMIDEFQAIVSRDADGTSADAQISATIQKHHRVGYVFTDSQTRLLTSKALTNSQLIDRLCSRRFIGSLPRADFAAFLMKKFRQSGFVIADDGPIEKILVLAQEVPYNVQMLAHHCWEELRSRSRSKPAKLTEVLVESVLQRTVKSLDPLFAQAWTGLTSAQQRALIAVIRWQGASLSSTDAARSADLAVSSLQSALRSLRDQNILREDPAVGPVKTRFADPFFAEWVKLTVM